MGTTPTRERYEAMATVPFGAQLAHDLKCTVLVPVTEFGHLGEAGYATTKGGGDDTVKEAEAEEAVVADAYEEARRLAGVRGRVLAFVAERPSKYVHGEGRFMPLTYAKAKLKTTDAVYKVEPTTEGGVVVAYQGRGVGK